MQRVCILCGFPPRNDAHISEFLCPSVMCGNEVKVSGGQRRPFSAFGHHASTFRMSGCKISGYLVRLLSVTRLRVPTLFASDTFPCESERFLQNRNARFAGRGVHPRPARYIITSEVQPGRSSSSSRMNIMALRASASRASLELRGGKHKQPGTERESHARPGFGRPI